MNGFIHLCYTSLVQASFERSSNLIIVYVMSNNPYMPNLGSLSKPHSLEEAPVVH